MGQTGKAAEPSSAASSGAACLAAEAPAREVLVCLSARQTKSRRVAKQLVDPRKKGQATDLETVTARSLRPFNQEQG